MGKLNIPTHGGVIMPDIDPNSKENKEKIEAIQDVLVEMAIHYYENSIKNKKNRDK